MAWTIKFDHRAKKELKKLSKNTQIEILSFLRKKIVSAKNPNIYAKPLANNKAGLWRFRVGKYRVIYKMQKQELIILVLRVGKRDAIYK